MTLLILAVLGLATWRVSSLFTAETGPFHIFTKIRNLTGIVHDSNEKVLVVPGKFLAEVFSCVWCFSIYAGTFWLILWLLFPIATFIIACLFALSTFAIIINKYAS